MSYIIAEMACSHDGSINYAKVIIDAAIKAGADAIQFQIWRHQDMVTPNHKDLNLLKKVELSHKEWESLYKYVRTKSKKIEIIACIYDQFSASFANDIGVDAFKIHTSDLSNERLIRFVSKFGKRIDLSVGSSSYDEILLAISWIRSENLNDIWLMYGKQLFPTKIEDADVLKADSLQKLFRLPVGYQDHTDGDCNDSFFIPIAARGAGIMIHEKHITHSRSHKGADYQAALNPDEFVSFVKTMRSIDTALGDGIPNTFTDAEIKYRVYSKKSLVASKDLFKGHKLNESDIIALRSNTLGMSADEFSSLIGKTLKKDIKKFDNFSLEQFK